MKGTDPRELPKQGLKEFASMISTDPFSDSFFIYNPEEVVKKLESWRSSLPWITPYYAVKSNPIQPLLADLGTAGGSFDCASKGV